MNDMPVRNRGDMLLCPVCGCPEFLHNAVLWPDLIDAWQLSESEVAYINRQQGFHCKRCCNNLRAMGLSAAVMREHGYEGTFEEFCNSGTELAVLEINRAGNLTPYLQMLPSHRLVEYPQFDMLSLAIESGSFDLVLHSDTLEHVSNPVKGLSECRRVLRDNGTCIFTVPIIVDRISRSRQGLAPSYHGCSGNTQDDQLVYTEFGVDIWKSVIGAGFRSCEFFSYEYPAALVLIARK